MIEIDDPSPLQTTPGSARVGHLLEHAMIVIAGVITLVGHIDQA